MSLENFLLKSAYALFFFKKGKLENVIVFINVLGLRLQKFNHDKI